MKFTYSLPAEIASNFPSFRPIAFAWLRTKKASHKVHEIWSQDTGRGNGLWLFGCNIYAACRWRYSTERPLHLNPASCRQDVSLFHWNARILPKELKNTSLKRLERVTKEMDRNNMFSHFKHTRAIRSALRWTLPNIPSPWKGSLSGFQGWVPHTKPAPFS